MFIKVKKASHSKNTVIQLVEAYRENGEPKQRVVKHIGTGKTESEIETLKELAETIKTQLKHDNLIRTITRAKAEYAKNIGHLEEIKNGTKLNAGTLQELNRYILGIHDIYGYVYELLEFVNPFSLPKRREYSAKILREIVLFRIADPCSKRSSVEKLQNAFGVFLNLDNVYQMMDKIDDKFCETIQEKTLAAALRLTEGKLKVLFYDATTLYFESFTEDELKQNGYSKDMKFNQPQVLFALFVTREGLPVGYEIFPGSTYEGHTLKPILEKLKNRYQIDEMIFVADRGMLSDDNLTYLETNEIPYIVGARLKSLSKQKQKEVLELGNKIKKVATRKESLNKDIEHTERVKIKNQKQLILSYRNKRAEKDLHDREKSLLKLQQKLSKSKNPKNIISNYGYQKYLKIEGDAVLKINEEKLEKESAWDGLAGVYTNQTSLSNTEILSHYRSLWQVEESFRISKHDLKIRPIYHWSPKRVKAHIAISFMAFACVRHLEYRVKMQYKKLSPEVIRKELLNVQASIITDRKTNKKYLLPSKLSHEAKQIYRVIGAKPPDQIQAIL